MQGPVEQRSARLPVTEKVAGSNPVRPANYMTEALSTENDIAVPADAPVSAIAKFYGMAKHAEWQVKDLDWQGLPPTPASEKASSRRIKLWRSVLSQQLQADELACQMASQLLNAAPHADAKLYYSTMVQDESRHTEAWLKLLQTLGDRTDKDPYLDKLVSIVLEAETIEEKIFLMQVFFEKAIIYRFEQIARGAGGTVLEQLCKKLKIDDGIHHGSGMVLERELLKDAPKSVRKKVVHTAEEALPYFVKHVLWRPPERAFVGTHMEKADREYLNRELSEGVRRGSALGLDFSEVVLPKLSDPESTFSVSMSGAEVPGLQPEG
jgi:hypothetical protein